MAQFKPTKEEIDYFKKIYLLYGNTSIDAYDDNYSEVMEGFYCIRTGNAYGWKNLEDEFVNLGLLVFDEDSYEITIQPEIMTYEQT